MLKGKLHGATVTSVNLDYEGSLSIDAALLEAAGILRHERIEAYNLTNGERFSTYAIEAPAGSGTIQVNGAAAHLVRLADTLIIAAYVQLAPHEAGTHQPIIVRLLRGNVIAGDAVS